jgi:hypothetical protein
MAIILQEVKTRRDINRFIRFSDVLYRGDPLYIPPLRADFRKDLAKQLIEGVYGNPVAAFLALRDGIVCGRIWVTVFLARPGTPTEKRQGAFNFFETIDDQTIADALFAQADAWFSAQGIDYYYGNTNPKDPDDARGVLIEGFDTAAVTMCIYNKPYYQKLFEKAGYGLDEDLYGYRLTLDTVPYERYRDSIAKIQERFRFTVDSVNPHDVDGEARDIIHAMENAIPDDWDMRPPAPEKVYELLESWSRFLDFDYIKIARTLEREPIGFTMVIPNFNDILKHLHGRLGPIGLLKLLYYRKRVKTVRAMIQTVAIPYQGKGVINAMYASYFDLLRKRGITWIDASTIGKLNFKSRNAIEKLGGKLYKIFRVYDRTLPAPSSPQAKQGA